MDRVHILNKKKSVTHKEGIFSPHNYAENSIESAFVVNFAHSKTFRYDLLGIWSPASEKSSALQGKAGSSKTPRLD